jgi:hypothetical protein
MTWASNICQSLPHARSTWSLGAPSHRAKDGFQSLGGRHSTQEARVGKSVEGHLERFLLGPLPSLRNMSSNCESAPAPSRRVLQK